MLQAASHGNSSRVLNQDPNIVSLLHFDNNFLDEKGRSWSNVGSLETNGVQKKFGTQSLYRAGTGSVNRLETPNSTDFDFGSGDFTIDWWEYSLDTANGFRFQRQLQQAGSPTARAFIWHWAGVMEFYAQVNAGDWAFAAGFRMGTITPNQWTHWALIRSGSNLYAAKDGILTTPLNVGTKAICPGSGPTILLGAQSDEQGGYFKGYIDEFCVTKGSARWISNFVPPNAPYGQNWVDPAMTSNSSNGYVASSNLSEVSPAYKAFNGVMANIVGGSDYWACIFVNPAILGLVTPSPVKVKGYKIYAGFNGVDLRTPRAWTFEASSDGSNWNILDTQTAQVFAANEAKVYSTDLNSALYNNYRLKITSRNADGATEVVIGELQLLVES